LKELDRPRHATLVNGTTPLQSLHGEQSADSLPSTAAPVKSKEDVKSPSRQVTNVVIGQQDPSSRYFTRKYVQIAVSKRPNASVPFETTKGELFCLLPELDPQAFELYQTWLHTGVIALRRQGFDYAVPRTEITPAWKDCWPLFNAHILGCTINDADSPDRVIDVLQEKLGNNAHQVDVDTINHLFSAEVEGIPQVLKDFVVCCCIEAGIESDFADLHIPSLRPTFFRLVLKSALQRLSREHRPQECEFHIHETPEACYKKRISPNDIEWEKRLNSGRQNSCKDFEQVMENRRNNGIKAEDWEDRRAEAHGALRLRTGRRRFGFTPIRDCKPMRTDAKLETETSAVQCVIEVLGESMRTANDASKKDPRKPGAWYNEASDDCSTCRGTLGHAFSQSRFCKR
jgi:hypothetical protein